MAVECGFIAETPERRITHSILRESIYRASRDQRHLSWFGMIRNCLLVVIPAYNEAATVAGVVERVLDLDFVKEVIFRKPDYLSGAVARLGSGDWIVVQEKRLAVGTGRAWSLVALLLIVVYPVPAQDVEDEATFIRSWARAPGDIDFSRVLRDSSWLGDWFKSSISRAALAALAIACVLGMLAIIIRGSKLNGGSRWTIATLIAP